MYSQTNYSFKEGGKQIMKKYLQLPITYEQANFEDERFFKMRVKVMHNGENLNKSTFSDVSIEKAAKTLVNVPLLAFVKRLDGEDYSDLAGHEYEFKATEDGIKYVYLGRPIGMVPETNNYSFEEDENGKKYVTVDGYVWTDYANEALEIIKRDGGKNVSMEIKVNGYSENDSIIDITDYTYTGIAFLGEDVPPAMMGARADLAEFSVQDEVQSFVSNFALELQKALTAEEDFVTIVEPENEAEEEVPAEEEETEVAVEEADTEEKVDIEELGRPIQDEPAEVVEDDTANPEEGKPSDPTEGKASDPTEGKPSDPTEGEPSGPFEEEIAKVKLEIETLRGELAEVVRERNELMAYKEKLDKAEYTTKLETLLTDFSDLEEDEINEIISKGNDLDEIELRLFAQRGKKNTQAPAKQIKTYAIWDSLVRKEQGEQPSWGDLVTKYYPKDNEGGN